MAVCRIPPVLITCSRCSTRQQVTIRTRRRRRDDDGRLLLELRMVPADAVLLGLFMAAHHGPFTAGSHARS